MRLLRQSGQRLLKYWIDLVQRTRIAVVIILPLLAVLALFYAMDNLGMNMETKDMLSP
ncbi:MAG: hypothetical protein P8126_07445 [Gammaproteobacteria bacterium]